MADYYHLICPLDSLALEQRGQSLYCAAGHCFDIDRKGAVNLLLVQFKNSAAPGDSREMVAARRQFLSNGLYAPIADKLNQLVAEYAALQGKMPFALLDAGCGEGFYTAGMARHLAQLNLPYDPAVIGLDISKEAIAAASASREATWLVGTNNHLPLAESSINVITCLFGFPVWDEFARVLKRRGLVITVDPGDDHLIELRRMLYPTIAPKDKAALLPTGFILEREERVTATMRAISAQHIAWLLTMTPHGYRATTERKQLALQDYAELTLDVIFKIYCL